MKPTFVILAGGIGKRFTPLTIDKTLIPFLGKPLIQHTLEMIERVGGKNVIIATNEHNHEFLSSYHSTLNVQTVLQPKPLGMGDALLHLKDTISDTPIVVMNAVDMVDDSLLKNLLIKAENEYAVVTGITRDTYFPGGYLNIDTQKGTVTSIIEKPGEGNEPSNLVNLVFHYFSQPQEFISLLQSTQSEADDQYEVSLAQLMRNHDVSFLEYNGYWQPLKYSYMVLDVMHVLLNNINTQYIHPTATIPTSAQIIGNVYIDEGVRVFENAVVKGPAYIGKKAVVGSNCLVRESVVETGAVTGFGSEITRSYLGPHCELHNNYIGDSVLESHINPSFGTCTANWRIDRQSIKIKYPSGIVDTGKIKMGSIVAKDVFCGVHCSLMPGTLIGEKAIIYPGKVVYENVEASETVK